MNRRGAAKSNVRFNDMQQIILLLISLHRNKNCYFPGLERGGTPGFPWLWELISGAGSTWCFLRRVCVIWMFGSCRLSESLRRSRGAAGFLSGALDGASISSALHHLLANATALGLSKCHLQPTSLPSLWEVFYFFPFLNSRLTTSAEWLLEREKEEERLPETWWHIGLETKQLQRGE